MVSLNHHHADRQVPGCLLEYPIIHYEKHATPGKAITVCYLSIVIAAIMAIAAKLVNSDFTNCAFHSMFMSTGTTNIVYDRMPKVFAAGIKLGVSI